MTVKSGPRRIEAEMGTRFHQRWDGFCGWKLQLISPSHLPKLLKIPISTKHTYIHKRQRWGKREEKARETEIKTEAQTKYFTVTFSIIDKSWKPPGCRQMNELSFIQTVE